MALASANDRQFFFLTQIVPFVGFLKKKYSRENIFLLYVIENILRTKEIHHVSCNNNNNNNNKGGTTRDLQCRKKTDCSMTCCAGRWERKITWGLVDSHKRTQYHWKLSEDYSYQVVSEAQS